jgi:hypothetical protein
MEKPSKPSFFKAYRENVNPNADNTEIEAEWNEELKRQQAGAGNNDLKKQVNQLREELDLVNRAVFTKVTMTPCHVGSFLSSWLF